MNCDRKSAKDAHLYIEPLNRTWQTGLVCRWCGRRRRKKNPVRYLEAVDTTRLVSPNGLGAPDPARVVAPSLTGAGELRAA